MGSPKWGHGGARVGEGTRTRSGTLLIQFAKVPWHDCSAAFLYSLTGQIKIEVEMEMGTGMGMGTGLGMDVDVGVEIKKPRRRRHLNSNCSRR